MRPEYGVAQGLEGSDRGLVLGIHVKRPRKPKKLSVRVFFSQPRIASGISRT